MDIFAKFFLPDSIHEIGYFEKASKNNAINSYVIKLPGGINYLGSCFSEFQKDTPISVVLKSIHLVGQKHFAQPNNSYSSSFV